MATETDTRRNFFAPKPQAAGRASPSHSIAGLRRIVVVVELYALLPTFLDTAFKRRL
jgi:hypothetical protein